MLLASLYRLGLPCLCHNAIATSTVVTTATATIDALDAELQAMRRDGVTEQHMHGSIAMARLTAIKVVSGARGNRYDRVMMSAESSNTDKYVPLFADLTELVSVMQEKSGWSDRQARAKLEFLTRLDAADEPLAARAGDLARSGYLQACVRFLCATDDECTSGCFEEGYMPSIGHLSVVPVPPPMAVAGGRWGGEGVVLGGGAGGGLSLGRIAELSAAACAFCARAAETKLAELPSTLDEEDRQLLRAFARDCRMQMRCSFAVLRLP